MRHQLSSIRSGEKQPKTNFIKHEIGSKMVSDTLNASFNLSVCTRNSKIVVIAIIIVLNHILNVPYADRSKPNKRLAAIKTPPIESIVDFIFIKVRELVLVEDSLRSNNQSLHNQTTFAIGTFPLSIQVYHH